jgi:hypothetical protein
MCIQKLFPSKDNIFYFLCVHFNMQSILNFIFIIIIQCHVPHVIHVYRE